MKNQYGFSMFSLHLLQYKQAYLLFFYLLYLVPLFSTFEASAGALNRPAAVGSRDIGLGCDPSDTLLPGNLASEIQNKKTKIVFGTEIMAPKFYYSTPWRIHTASKNMAYALPYLSYAKPIDDWGALKINLTTPFGIGASFDQNPQLLGYDTSTLISQTTLVPSISFDLTKSVSLGFGANIGWAQFECTAPFDINEVPLPIGTSNKATGISLTGGVGLLFHQEDYFAVGINYMGLSHSPLKGNMDISLGPIKIQDNFETSITFPDKLDLALAWKPFKNGKWLVCSDYNWFGYSKTPNKMKLSLCNLPISKSKDLSWQDSFSTHIGSSYILSDCWTIRGGLGYMSQSIPSKTISTLTPDMPGWDIGFACTYKLKNNISLDVSITHSWGSTSVNKGIIQSEYSAQIDTFALIGSIDF